MKPRSQTIRFEVSGSMLQITPSILEVWRGDEVCFEPEELSLEITGLQPVFGEALITADRKLSCKIVADDVNNGDEYAYMTTVVGQDDLALPLAPPLIRIKTRP